MIIVIIIISFLVFMGLRKFRQTRGKDNKQIQYYRYTEEEFPIVVFYDYSPDRQTNLGDEFNIIQSAINHINKTTNFTFFTMLTPGIIPKKIETVLHLKDSTYTHECVSKFDGPYGVLAHAYFPPIKKICIDASEEWSEEKLHNTLIHEFGHSLGLVHDNSKKYPSIMNSRYSSDVVGLQPTDVKKLRNLYPFIGQ